MFVWVGASKAPSLMLLSVATAFSRFLNTSSAKSFIIIYIVKKRRLYVSVFKEFQIGWI